MPHILASSWGPRLNGSKSLRSWSSLGRCGFACSRRCAHLIQFTSRFQGLVRQTGFARGGAIGGQRMENIIALSKPPSDHGYGPRSYGRANRVIFLRGRRILLSAMGREGELGGNFRNVREHLTSLTSRSAVPRADPARLVGCSSFLRSWDCGRGVFFLMHAIGAMAWGPGGARG